MSEKNPWTTLSSKVVYSNPWITVKEDQVIRPDGTPGIYGVVSSLVACAVLPINDKGEIYMIGQYRYPTRRYSWEIVAGGCHPGEPALDAAKRELREEAGVKASHWTEIKGEVHLSNCFSSETAHIFIAQDLEEVQAEPDGTEVLQVKRISFHEVLKMVNNGEIQDALTIIAVLRAASILERPSV